MKNHKERIEAIRKAQRDSYKESSLGLYLLVVSLLVIFLVLGLSCVPEEEYYTRGTIQTTEKVAEESDEDDIIFTGRVGGGVLGGAGLGLGF